MYVEKSELAEEIRKYHETGRASERLGEILLLIAEGACRAFGTGTVKDTGHATGQAVVRMLGVLPRVNPDMDPFNYLTQVAKNEVWFVFRGEKNFRKLCRNVARDVDLPEGGHGGATKLDRYLDTFDRPARVEIGGEAVAEVVEADRDEELPDEEDEELLHDEGEGFIVFD